jgi:molecular chaperone DnaK
MLERVKLGKVEEAVKRAKEELESGDTARIKAAMETLQKETHHLAELMYQSAKAAQGGGAGAPGGGQAGGGTPKDADVVDAEFEEK